jgi:hypothetical protein
MVQWLFWTDTFEFHEDIIQGTSAQAAELAGFVQRMRPYSSARLSLAARTRGFSDFVGRVRLRLTRNIRRTPLDLPPVEERTPTEEGGVFMRL